MKTLAVLITCFNRKKFTKKCLSYLYVQQLPKDYQVDVYLTDDGCTDGTADMVNTFFPLVNIVQGNGKLFWNRGMYKAWKVATATQKYDYYLWLNDDTFLFKDALSAIIKTSELTDNESIIVGTVKSASTDKVSYGGRNEAGELILPNGQTQKCHHFNGNVVLVPSFVYKKLGYLDPIFHHAMGDFDYGMRAIKSGINAYITQDILGTCELHESFPKWCSPTIPIRKRIKFLYLSSCDCYPPHFFIFERRHYGLFRAIKHYITIHTRVIFPKLWVS